MREKIKGVVKFAAFAICLGLLIHWIDRTVVIKYMYDHSEPQTLTYEGFYNMKKESVDVLIMGTSQAAAGFNPQDLYNARQIRSYNLASSAQPVWLTYYWLKEALNYQKPSVVVFDCNYMFSDRIYEDSCRRALDYMRWGRTKTEAVRAVVEYDIYADENILSYVFPFFRFHERWKEFDEWDFNWADFSGTPSPLKGFWYYDGHDQNTDYELFTDAPADPDSAVFNERSEEYLDKIYSLCQDNGIELILVKTPYHVFTKAHHEQVASWAEKNKVPFIDFNEEELVQATGFDYHAGDINDVGEGNGHVNFSGARKLSTYLADYIADNHYAESTFDEQWETSRAFNDAMYHNFELTGTEDLEKYLGMLREDRYAVVISAKRGYDRTLSDRAVEELRSLGLDETLCDGLQKDSSKSYLAVIDRGKILHEELSEQNIYCSCSIRNNLVRLEAILRGSGSSGSSVITFDEVEQQKNSSGLNIVVYDYDRRRVIDAVNFAIGDSDLTCSR